MLGKPLTVALGKSVIAGQHGLLEGDGTGLRFLVPMPMPVFMLMAVRVGVPVFVLMVGVHENGVPRAATGRAHQASTSTSRIRSSSPARSSRFALPHSQSTNRSFSENSTPQSRQRAFPEGWTISSD